MQNLATQADELKAIQTKRRDLQKEVDALKSEEGIKTDALIHALTEVGATSIGGQTVTATIVRSSAPANMDWDAVQAHITTCNAWDLVRRQLVDTAVQARWDAGEVIPGVGARIVVKLSLTKPGV